MARRWLAGFRSAMLSPHEAAIVKPARGFADHTLRQIVHLDGGGDRIRVRLSNRYGTVPLAVARTRVALHTGGSSIDPATDVKVRFDSRTEVRISAGEEAVSDPVELAAPAGTDLAISTYLADPTGPATFAHSAWQTGYLAGGDATATTSLADHQEFTMRFFLSGLDVWAEDHGQVVVAFGDSLIEGAITTIDANRRFSNLLTARLIDTPRWVVNAGIGGNRLLGDQIGERGLTRLDRDVLAVPGVGHMVVHFGVNDLGLPAVFGFDTVTAGQLINGFTELANRARSAGIGIHAATIVPFGGSTALDSPATRRIRGQVNDWIRHGGRFDSVADFDAALADPADPHRLAPNYDSGDGVHPNDAGTKAMADTVDLAAFTTS